ncbi:MAG: hypothetical protein ACT4O1_07955 [Gemmatimonadota bacterium]
MKVTFAAAAFVLNSLGFAPALSAQNPPALKEIDNVMAYPSSPSGRKHVLSVDLTGPAPKGGVVVSLNHGGGSGPATVTVPGGSASVAFETTMPVVATTSNVIISATYNGVTKNFQLQVTPAELLSVSVEPYSVISGTAATGRVALSGVPAGGAVVTLDHGGGAGPSSITVLNAQTATFQTTPPRQATQATLTIGATYKTVTKTASLRAIPATTNISSFTIAPSVGQPIPTAIGGAGRFSATVTLDQAQSSAVAITVSSSHSAAVVPSPVFVAAGQSSATFHIPAAAVQADVSATISVGQGASAKTATVMIKPMPALLTSIDAPQTILGGSESTARVRCNCVSWAGTPGMSRFVSVESSNAAVLTAAGGGGEFGGDASNIPVTLITQPVSSPTPVVITARFGNETVTTSIMLEPAAQVASITLNPQHIYEAGSATVTITLDKAAPTGGARITLRSSAPAVTVPADVTVAAGQTTATFPATAASLGNANIIAQRGNGVGKTSAPLAVVLVEALRIEAPANPYELGSATGTVLLQAPVVTSPLKIALASSGSAVVVPPEITIGVGASSGTFPILLASAGSATLTARRVDGIRERQLAMTVKRNQIASLTLSPTTVTAGGTATGTITLEAPAGNGGVEIALNGTDVTVPAVVMISAGATSATFAASVPEAATSTRTVTARRTGATTMDFKSATLTVPGPALQSLSISPTTVSEGQSAAVTVTLDAVAGASGVLVTLNSGTSHVAVPTTVMVPAGQKSITLTANTTGPVNATIRSTSGSSQEKQALLLVKAVQVKSVVLGAGEIRPGQSIAGTVTLDAAAPASGVTITFTSSDAAIALPAKITIAAGSNMGTFTATGGENVTAGTATIEAARMAMVTGLVAGPKATTTITVTR